ncbi:IS3 family transposase [Lachnospiraceae bacterium 47-T17]
MKESLRLKRENEEFGTRWLLGRRGICPNACYNYRKHRKEDYYAKKAEVLGKIDEIYHKHSGVDGCRNMTACLEREGYSCSTATIHKYMNTQMGLHSMVRRKKPGTKPGNF